MSSFSLQNTIGQHSVYKMEKRIPFLDYFKHLYNCENLQQLQHSYSVHDDLTDVETDLHKKFYNDIKTNPTFERLYCQLIHDIFCHFFPDESVFIYQTFPSIRIQFQNNVVVPPHYDSDSIGNHPVGEKNFILPITKMYGTNRVFIETEPDRGDFQGVDLDYGELFYFNGNRCTHCNEKNTEKDIRLSLDFRVILWKDYKSYIQQNIVYTNPRDNRTPLKMVVGSYYQSFFPKNNRVSIDDMIQQRITHNKNMIVQTRPNFDVKEAEACYEYLKSGENFITEYKETAKLEKMICDFTGSSYCVMTTSGTSALILALLSLGIGKGMDVIVPNYTMIASVHSIRMVGANPILVDVDLETGSLSKESIEKNITPNTRAVLHVSLNNRTKDLNEIVEYCDKNALLLIEDAAQSLGCFLNKKHIGTYGVVGCFSLSTPKIISTGQGGFLLTEKEEIYKKLSMIKNFGRREGGSEIYETFGLNMKFTDIQAVIGIEQMKKLPCRIQRMREIYDLYYKNLHDVCKMIPPMNDEWIPWFIDVYVEDRDELSEFLKKHNIQTRITYPQIHQTNTYLEEKRFEFSEYYSTKGLFLPSHTLLSNDDISYISSIIQLYFVNK